MHTKLFYPLLAFLVFSISTYAQVGIGTTTPDSSAQLEVFSTTKGFLPPVMTQVQRDAINNPAEGLMLYCSNCSKEGYYVFQNGSWLAMDIDDQTISRSGLTVTLEDGGSFQDSVLTETEVDAMVSDNGYLTSFTEVDGSITNELQTISRSGLTISLDNGGGSFQDSVLTEAEVDAMVSNNGYISSESDDQTLNLSNNDLSIESGNTVDLSSYLDNTDNQTISRSGLTVTLEDGGSFQDSVLTETDVDAMVSNNGYISSESDDQTLSLSNNDLSIESGNTVDLSSYLDNTDNQTISRSGLTVTLEDGGSFQDSVLTEAEVDAFISNNGYLSNSTLSTDGTLSDNSMSEVPTESAVKAYVDNSISSASVVVSTDGTLSDNSTTEIPTESAVKTYVDSSAQLTGTAYGNYNYHTNQGNMVNMVGGGHYNYGIGRYSLYSVTTGDRNIGIGQATLYETNTSNDNIAIGHNALKVNTGSSNAAIGSYALYDNTTGAQNLAVGKQALYNSISGNDNIALGYDALRANLTSSGSVAIGTGAGRSATGSGHVFLGYQAGYSELGNDMLYIENSNSTSPLIGGSFSGNRVGINTPATNLSSGATLQVGGDISILNGATINEFSTDNTLAGNSDDALPTEKAVKTYVDNSKGLLIHSTYTTNMSSNTGSFTSASMSSSAIHNLGIGQNTLASVTNAQYNVAVGNYALDVATTGGGNTAVGVSALSAVTTGISNTAVGREALEGTTGSYSVALGANALEFNTTASSNVAIGYKAGQSTSGGGHVLIGYQAGWDEWRNNTLYIENTSSDQPLIGGSFAYDRVAINKTLTEIVANAATFQVGGDISILNGTIINEFSTDGTLAGNSDDALPTEKAVKDYVDDNATKLVYATSGLRNYHTNLSNMTSVTSSGNYNMASGYEALKSLTGGDYNLAHGIYSLKSNTTGNQNIAIGYNALFWNISGSYNVALGKDAGLDITGSYNTVVGHESGENTTGSYNTFLGRRSGYNSQSNSSVFLGYYAGYSEDTDGRLYIENSSTGTPLIGGDFVNNKVGINMDVDVLANTNAALQVGGAASKSSSGSWIANSDRRLKTNIEYMQAEEMLQKMLQLKGASYEWNDTVTAYANTRPEGIQYGFIAQDIEKVWPSKIAKDGQGYLMTAYGDYDPMFVESIRALNNKIEELKLYVAELEKDNDKLKGNANKMDIQKEEKIEKLSKRLDEMEAFIQQNLPQKVQASTK